MLSETFKQHAEAGPVMTYLIQLIIRLFPLKFVGSRRLIIAVHLDPNRNFSLIPLCKGETVRIC